MCASFFSLCSLHALLQAVKNTSKVDLNISIGLLTVVPSFFAHSAAQAVFSKGKRREKRYPKYVDLKDKASSKFELQNIYKHVSNSHTALLR